jgi:hypothetical protein
VVKSARLTLILILAGLACAPALPAARGAGDRGFREAEQVLAAATDIRIARPAYLARVAEAALSPYDRSRSVACDGTSECEYIRHFEISLGPRTIAALLFIVRTSPAAPTPCGGRTREDSCSISSSVFAAGDETFPHCVALAPIIAAATRNGWRLAPQRHPSPEDIPRYRHQDDADTYLFIRTLADARCIRGLHIARIPRS